MSITDWIFSTCGRSHIGIYVCSRCGYELLRSDLERNFFSASSLSVRGLFTPSTISARSEEGGEERGKNGKGVSKILSFNGRVMLDDFSKNASLGRTFHKNSISRIAAEISDGSKYKLFCGKCGNSLGHQILDAKGQSTFVVKPENINLIFRTS